MKLKKWLKYIDTADKIRIYTPDCEDDECAWEGFIWDMPWIYAEGKIDERIEYPIHLNNDNGIPEVVVNIIV